MSRAPEQAHVVIVGAGFAGIACAKELAKHDDVRATLINHHNYHQFLALPYHVATSQLAASDGARGIRNEFRKHPNVNVKMAEVVSADPTALAVRLNDGQEIAGSHPGRWEPTQLLPHPRRRPARGSPVLALGLGATALAHPDGIRGRRSRLRSGRVRRAELRRGGGRSNRHRGRRGPRGDDPRHNGFRVSRSNDPTGQRDPRRRWTRGARTLLAQRTRVRLEGAGPRRRRDSAWGSVKEIGPGHATLSDETTILARCVIWGGGLMAAPLAENSGIAQGRGGSIDVLPDLTVADHPRLYALGDFANVPGPDGKAFPPAGFRGAAGGAAGPRRTFGPISTGNRERTSTTTTRASWHDRTERHRRRGREASPRAARRHRLRGVAGGPRRVAERRSPARGRLRELSVGLLHEDSRAAGARPLRCHAHRLGRRRAGRSAPRGGATFRSEGKT